MINRDNYKAVKRYLTFQSEVMQLDAETIKRKDKHLKHLLRWADETALTAAPDIRPVFPRYLLSAQRNIAGQKPLSAVGIKRTCGEARRFFTWAMVTSPKDYQAVSEGWVLTLRPVKMPVAPRQEHEAVTLDMVQQLMTVTGEDIASRRDRAAAAMLFLSGVRATAFCTLSLETVDVANGTILQYPTLGVRTKNLKTIQTSLLDIPDLLAEVEAWDAFVRSELPPSAPWYAVIQIVNGEQVLTAREPGRYRSTLFSRRMKRLFRLAGLPPMSPHKFRHGHALYALKRSRTISDFKAVSMHLGHASLSVTDQEYGILSDDDVHERIMRFSENGVGDVDEERLLEVLREVLRRVG